MPPGRKKSLTNDDFVDAAIAYADVNGLSSLTLKVVGDQVGLTQTAVYRYFRSKDELVGAMKESIIGQMLVQAPDASLSPRTRLTEWAMLARSVFRQHPCLADLVLVLSMPADNLSAMTRRVVSDLEDLGIPGPLLPSTYQALEGLVVGSSMIDYSGMPHHLETRLERYRSLRHPAFDEITRDTASIDAVNEAAFERTLSAVLDHFESLCLTSR
jgi:AcrR family transcriptional regulator